MATKKSTSKASSTKKTTTKKTPLKKTKENNKLKKKNTEAYTWQKPVADLVAISALGGWTVAQIMEWLNDKGYQTAGHVTFRKLYKKELNAEKEYLLKLQRRAFALAETDKTMLMFVLKCRARWRETDRQEIDITQQEPMKINLSFAKDDTVERNKI